MPRRTSSPPRVLVVSPNWPPVNCPDMQRVRSSVKYFEEFGWQPVVLHLTPDACGGSRDPLLVDTLPPDLESYAAAPPDNALLRAIGMRTALYRCVPVLARAGSRLLARNDIDLVYFSTTMFVVMALGRYWKHRFGVPYVVDWQDPWVNDYYAAHAHVPRPGGRLKHAVASLIGRVLEPATLREASHVISVSPEYPTMLKARYPWLRDEQFTVLPFGAAPDDFEILARRRVTQRVFDPSDGNRHWLYVGRAGADLAPALKALFLAVSAMRAAHPGACAGLRLHFVGTDYASEGRARSTVQALAADAGIGDIVTEQPRRIPYFEALRCLTDAQALLLCGSDDPTYTASKLFPYVLAARPLLAVVHERSSVGEILRRLGVGVVVTFDERDAAEDTAREIARRWPATDPSVVDTAVGERFEPFSARSSARVQCGVFDACVGRKDAVVPPPVPLLSPV